MSVSVTIEFSPVQAAALVRLCDKLSHEDAKRFLYPHVPADLRAEQAYAMVQAAAAVHKALIKAGARSWPWLDTGEVEQ